MNNKKLKSLFILLVITTLSFVKAQNSIETKWWNPLNNPELTIMGQGWPGETESPFDRLPARAKKIVREPVWNLSHNSAGLVIRFKTNAKDITVEYSVSGDFAMTHMPATGVSGVDLYSIDKNNTWLWCAGKRSFGDTIKYTFTGIEYDSKHQKNGIEYRLYLPLYNNVKWLRIGVTKEDEISTLPVCFKKPIVVYGTSITQGACASRPGMAWTAQVGRKLNLPVINLGFSGEGKLDKEIIKLISEIDAELYIIDCMPNMTAPRFTNKELTERINFAVTYLKKKHPNTPILLTEHDGYSDENMRPERFKNYNDINIVLRNTFKDMKKSGIENIYLLPHSEIDMNIDSQVDGIHANDWGMFKYSRAYSQYINVILGL